jgi:uncharacterized coiled-coil protein SlyX
VEPHHDEFEPSAQQTLGAPRRRRGATFFVVILLLVVVAVAGYGWFNYESIVQTAFSAPQPTMVQPRTSNKEPAPLEDFQVFQKQTADALQSVSENMVSQKADLQRLSDQVSALTAKVDAAQAALAMTQRQPVPTSPPVVTAARKPQAPKPGRMSVGGAPLPATSSDQ